MGRNHSIMEVKEQGECRDEYLSETNIQDEPNMEAFHRIDIARWADLMYSLQSIARLQRAATRARIEARQKRREATFKRQDVWIWDAKFMGEIQKLNAQGKLQGFEELSRLAAECQNSRDLLGPLEQDSIEAESRWQGQIWKLKEYEEELYTDFEEEFKDAAENVNAHGGEETSSQPSSDSVSQSSTISNENDQIIRKHAANSPVVISENEKVDLSTPLELMYDDAHEFGDGAELDLDSGFGDIDSILGTTPVWVNKYGRPKVVPKNRRSGMELYHELLEDFSTRRERVNKWLENNALQSRLESLSIYSVLQELLELEDQHVPSNWANLVVAYWELDEASMPAPERQHYERNDGLTLGKEQLNTSNVKAVYENKPSSITKSASELVPRIQLDQEKHRARSDEGRINNIFGDNGLAPPKSIPPSPDSQIKSRSTSRDRREEKLPP